VARGGICSLPPWAAAVGIFLFFKKIELLKD
jgi:hypothetical protein